MTMAEFLKAVDEAGGDEKLVMVIFDNSGRLAMPYNKHFNRATMVKGEFFVTEEKDIDGNEMICYKNADCIQGIIFAKTEKDFKHIQRQYIRG